MTMNYVVTVLGVDDDGETTTLVELRAPVGMLRQFAPQAVAAALGTTAQDAALIARIDPPRMAMEGPAETPGQPAPRRTRRTKAEMEVARAAGTAMPIVQTPAPDYPEPAPLPAEASSAYNPFGNN